MKKLFLVDAYALIYRFYYAFMSRPMRNAEGMNTSPIFGFVKFMRDIIRKENPQYIGVAFDSKGDTFRHELYTEYKANRDAAPEDIHASVPYIKQVMEAMRIPCIEKRGWEADDLIGTISCKAEAEGFEVYMVTPDKDFGQLVRPKAFIYKQLKGGEGIEIVGPDRIREIYGVDDPRLIIDILALWGDASDNIPGVPGIGEKSAVKLVCEFGTVEQILDNIDKIKGKQREKILDNREQLILSKQLATIDTEAPIEFDPEKLQLENPDSAALKEIFRHLGFNMFIREVEACVFIPDVNCNPDESAVQAVAHLNVTASEAAEQAVPKMRKKATAGNQMQGSLFGSEAADLSQGDSNTTAQYTGNTFEDDLGTNPRKDGYENYHTVDHSYSIIGNVAELERIVNELAAKKEICLFTETSGPNPISDPIIGISLSGGIGEAWFVPLDGQEGETYISILKSLLENESISKIGQDLKFDIVVLSQAGISIKGFKYDNMVLHYLLDPDSRHGLSYICRTYLGYSPIERETLTGKGVRQLTMDKVEQGKTAGYMAEMADINFRLKQVLWQKIISENLADLYSSIEEPLLDVLADIEMTGVKVDIGILTQAGLELNRQLAVIEEKVRKATEEPKLNVNSPMQLGEALFGKMKIDPKPKLTKTKQYRTDEEYLQSFAAEHPVINMVLEYRGIKKLLTTYIEALPQLVNPKTGRIHTTYNQTVAATGRLSSSNPNLQNIPIRDEQGREIRKAFVATDTDHILLSADYSQVELRLMAHLSGDKTLLEAFNNREDIHSATASLIFGIPLPEVTQEHRRKAKTANFGIMYGISAFGLSQRLNIPRAEAKEIIDGYFRSYPGIKEYMDKVIYEAGEKGYVQTLFGRKRWLPDIKSANAVARGWAQRNAINAPLQGSAADIIKLAMISINKQFKAEGLRSKVILQVHDELVVDMYRKEQERVVSIVTGSMQHAAQLKVILEVDYGTGTNWMEAH